QTRSGHPFSPWVKDFGVPIHAPKDFDLAEHIRAVTERDAACTTGEIVTERGTAGALDLERDSNYAAVAHGLLGQEPARGHLGTYTGPVDITRECADRGPGKDDYHSKQRSKARRRKARGYTNVIGDLGVAKRAPKRSAVERRKAAQVLRTRALDQHGIEALLEKDSGATTSQGSLPIETEFSLAMEDVHVCKTAYLGKRAQDEAERGRVYTPQELVDIGFDYISTPRPILSREGKVIAVLVGQPRDANWHDVNTEMQEIMENARDAYQPPPQKAGEGRGDFISMSTGISYGGGQTRPMNVSAKTELNANVMGSLRVQKPVKRVANFGNSAFQLFAPRLHEYYGKTLDALCHADPGLQPNFPNNVFASATFNLGPRTVSVPHRDSMNLSFGMCAITAMGTYEPRRYSFTQYSAGGLFRWVESGHRPVKSLPRMKSKEAEALGMDRWERGIGLLSFWSELSGEESG
ncbi:hypothetical protein C2E23DRAFT_721296, partial [Lenzites betulinus]